MSLPTREAFSSKQHTRQSAKLVAQAAHARAARSLKRKPNGSPAALAAADHERAPPTRLLKKSEVLAIVGVSYPSLWAWMRAGHFPRSRVVRGHSMWLSSRGAAAPSTVEIMIEKCAAQSTVEAVRYELRICRHRATAKAAHASAPRQFQRRTNYRNGHFVAPDAVALSGHHRGTDNRS